MSRTLAPSDSEKAVARSPAALIALARLLARQAAAETVPDATLDGAKVVSSAKPDTSK